MKIRKKSTWVLSTFLGLGVFLVGCKSRKFHAGDASLKADEIADAAPFSPWDFTFQLQRGVGNPITDLPSITQFISKDTFDKVIQHMLLESGASADNGDAAVISMASGKGNQFERIGSANCIRDSANWKVQAVRIAPYEMSFSGDIAKINAFLRAKDASLRADLAPELRLVVNPVCTESTPDGPIAKFQDAGFHLVFSIAPPKELQNKVSKSADLFLSLAKEGKGKEAGVALVEHAKIIASKEYQDFRREFIRRLFPLVSHRKNLGTSAYKDLDTKILPLLGGSNPKFLTTSTVGFDKAAGGSAQVMSPGFDNMDSVGYRELNNVLRRYATQDRLSAIAIFAIARQPGQWVFAMTSSSGKPIVLQSVGFRIKGDGITSHPLHNQGFYGGVGTPNEKDVASKAVENVDLLQEYDFLNNNDMADKKKFFEMHQQEINAKTPLLLNVERTNATTSTCASCHVLSNTSKKADGSFVDNGAEPASNFHVTTFMGMGPMLSSRMVNEVVHESALMNKEMKQLGLTFVASEIAPAPPAPAPPAPVPPAPVPPETNSAAVSAVFCRVKSEDGSMNVRASPSSTGAVIGVVPNNTGFNRVGQSGQWLKVEIRIDGKLQGNNGSVFKEAYIFEKGVEC